MIEFLTIDEQETIMNMLYTSDFNGRILVVVLLQIEAKACGNTGRIDSSGDAFFSLGQLEQNSVV